MNPDLYKALEAQGLYVTETEISIGTYNTLNWTMAGKAAKENGIFNNKEQNKMTARINTISTATTAVRAKGYIVGSVSDGGDVSFSANPVVHYSPVDARNECKRLARENHGKMFVFVQLSGAEMVPVASGLSI